MDNALILIYDIQRDSTKAVDESVDERNRKVATEWR
jgi:hypothetical protein